MACVSMVIVYLALIFSLFIGGSFAQLSTNFYSSSCPKLLSTVKPVLRSEIAKEKRLGASILRLFFHDCFVNGCDGSILLADSANFTGEHHAGPNNRTIRGFKAIDKIKTAVENVCPGVVSCADILAIAARDSVVILGGPNWNVKLGRRDSRTANKTLANNNIPPPTSNLSGLISMFAAQGLSTKDMVALSGGHTIGLAHCKSFRAHIYNDTNIDPGFASLRKSICQVTSGDNNLAPEDLRTPTVFDNNYYKNLVVRKGLLHSDQQLFNGSSTDSLVKKYSSNEAILVL